MELLRANITGLAETLAEIDALPAAMDAVLANGVFICCCLPGGSWHVAVMRVAAVSSRSANAGCSDSQACRDGATLQRSRSPMASQMGCSRSATVLRMLSRFADMS